jgi:putative hydrolase of the HAD superfamily
VNDAPAAPLKVSAIVFDWHGVLDLTTFAGLMQRLSNAVKVEPTRVDDLIRHLLRSYMSGQIDPATFWTQAQTRLGLTTAQVQQARDYILTFRKNDALWSLLPHLKQRFNLGVLSDCPVDKIGVVRREADLSLFTAVHFSAEMHQRKVSDEFLYGIARALQQVPTTCLYVDDRKPNLDFAFKLGFKTCHYTTLEWLEQCIREVAR